MACKNCAKIRSAILHGKMAQAAGLTVTALREKIGIKADEPAAAAPVALVGEQAPESILPASKVTKSGSKQ